MLSTAISNKPNLKVNMTRLARQIQVLQLIENIVPDASKVVITPTKIGIKSNHKVGKEYYAQVAAVNKIVQEQGMLPFNVEVVAHG